MEKCINFMELPIKDIEGNYQKADVRKVVGNVLFNLADDVAEHDLGIKIYHSEGAVTIDEKEEAIIRKYANSFKYLLQTALNETLNPV